MGVGIAFGGIPAGPAIMVGGTIGALAGSRIGKPEFGTFAAMPLKISTGHGIDVIGKSPSRLNESIQAVCLNS